MYGHVLVSLFKTTVFTHIVQIVTTNNNGALHFQFLHNSVQDTTTDAHITSEWTFLVDVCSIHGLEKVCEISIERLLNFIKLEIIDINSVSLLTSLGVLNPNPTSR